jgi:hypothetical protein
MPFPTFYKQIQKTNPSNPATTPHFFPHTQNEMKSIRAWRMCHQHMNYLLSSTFLTFEMWHPSRKLQEPDKFEKKILCDHTSIPCSYCSILMMSAAVKWVDYDPDETYDVTSCSSTTFAMEQ